MSEMIQSSEKFMTSVNISYDMGNISKIENFIPTKESLRLLERFLLSTEKDSSDRAHILIGAYGKGKSCMMLELLSLLNSTADNLPHYRKIIEKAKEYKSELALYAEEYIKSEKRLLPIVINGSSASLSQSFLYALYSTLKQKEFSHLMPETHFESACKMIDLWQEKYPETYSAFNEKASIPASVFREKLLNYEESYFEEFNALYPELTSGGEFNPFSGFDVAELYGEVSEKIEDFGYSGLYVIYDEFGKYLESSISKATIKDVKLLQDFAEKAQRSGKEQLHLMLICHKEIENYIDILPKQKVDGWKGISERFSHIHVESDPFENYELISASIVKKPEEWSAFVSQNRHQFEALKNLWQSNKLFSDLSSNEFDTVIYGCYPLHPVTAYILPFLSEKTAQNERTLFTFLCSKGNNTFLSAIKGCQFLKNDKIFLLTPDVLYDYFSSSMQAEPYSSEIKKQYMISQNLLQKTKSGSLEEKIVKTITLVYCLNQFDRLSPSSDTIAAIYSDCGFSFEDVKSALVNLKDNLRIIYERINTNFLQLKEDSGVDISGTISETIEKRRTVVTDVEILNLLNTEKYLYPVEYNTELTITRYFEFVFIDEKDVKLDILETYCHKYNADGIVFGILPSENYDAKTIEEEVRPVSEASRQTLFVIPKKHSNIHDILRSLDAVSILRKNASSDKVLFAEYDIMYQDLLDVASEFIHEYTQPEKNLSIYICEGQQIQKIYRKANLTSFLSSMIKKVYSNTPAINNEILNKNNLSGQAYKSRIKLLNGILSSHKSDLDLTGSGQEVSFMRSSLLLTGILDSENQDKKFNLEPKTTDRTRDKAFKNLFHRIEMFVKKAGKKDICFSELYSELTGTEKGIGLRRGVIPVYFAVSVSDNIKNMVIKRNSLEVPINAATLSEMVDSPEEFSIRVLEWNNEKEKYIKGLEAIFADYISIQEKESIGYNFILNAIEGWYRGLPKYSKQIRKKYLGNNAYEKIKTEYISFIDAIREHHTGAQETLFSVLPEIFGEKEFNEELIEKIKKAKLFFDSAKYNLEDILSKETLSIISSDKEVSLKNACMLFLKKLSSEAKNHVFENGAQKLIPIFENSGNDEIEIVESLAPVLTGLFVDDWTDETSSIYIKQFKLLTQTLLNYITHKSSSVFENNASLTTKNSYSISFIGKDNFSEQRTFDKVLCSEKAEILEDEIQRTLDEMGQSVSEGEKRQVLVNLLERIC